MRAISGSGPRFDLSYSTQPASVYEIEFPMPRTPIWNDRIPAAELALPSSAKKSDVEIEGMKKYLGMK